MIFTAAVAAASPGDLHEMLETRGLIPVGAPTWSGRGARRSVTVPVLPEYTASGNGRPDMSLDALAGELLDWRAA